VSILDLPIEPAECNRLILTPALALLPPRMDTAAARVMLIAMALQESGLNARAQHSLRPGMPPGPARGLWQFERGGGVRGVLRHDATTHKAHELCAHFGITSTSHAVWNAIETNDVLAACFARLLLWTDAGPLPTTEAAGWETYLRTWRPGKPHPERWPRNFKLAQEAIE
jgi:hypothetical protein